MEFTLKAESMINVVQCLRIIYSVFQIARISTMSCYSFARLVYHSAGEGGANCSVVLLRDQPSSSGTTDH